jgi:HK97 family phage major capsid protein
MNTRRNSSRSETPGRCLGRFPSGRARARGRGQTTDETPEKMARYTSQIEKHKRDKRDLVDKQRSIIDTVEKEKRAMSTEERSEFDKMNGAIDGHESRISDLEKLNKREDEPVEGDEPASVTNAEADDTGSRSGGRIGIESRSDNGPVPKHATKEYRTGFHRWMRTGEKRDMTVGTQSSGGYLVAPIQMSDDIIKQTDNLCFIRELAKVYKLDRAQAIGVKQMISRISDANWTTEIGQITSDTSMAFNRRDLTPNQLTKLALVSILLMEQEGSLVEGIVNEEIAYKFATTQENTFLNGTGSAQPLGVFTASASGIPTSQDYTSTATASFLADDLIGMKYAIKQTYFGGPKCRWVMGRPIVQQVRTFKDSYGQYLWRAGLASDKPDTVLDVPLAISEYAPTVKTTGSYIAVLGNFGYYGIAQLKTMSMQRLVERYADTSEIGFLGRWFIDGAPLLGEAFVRLKTA